MSENREREERRPGPGPGGPGPGPRGMMEHTKAKDAKGTFKRLLKYISEHIGRIVLISILCAASALISAANNVSCADGRAVRAFLMAWHPPETGGYSLEGFF